MTAATAGISSRVGCSAHLIYQLSYTIKKAGCGPEGPTARLCRPVTGGAVTGIHVPASQLT
jgi:hypothetical protein